MTGDGMKRSVGLALLMAVVCPLVLAAQGVPTAPAALPVDSLLKAANAAAAANTVAINFVWTLVAGVLLKFIPAGVATVGAGLTQAHNPAPPVAMDLHVARIASLAYLAIGFALPTS